MERRKPQLLHSWLKQERLAFRHQNWRFTALVALLMLGLLVGFEAVRRLYETRRQLQQEQKQTLELLQSWLVEHRRTAQDWAHWDETLAYVQGRNPDFRRQNIDTTTLLQGGAVMAIFNGNGEQLTIAGGTADEPLAADSRLNRCLSDVEEKRRLGQSKYLAVLCPGRDQLFVGSIESISDSTATVRTNASLAYLAPALTTPTRSPLASIVKRLHNEFLLDDVAAGKAAAQTIDPPLWTTGGRPVRVQSPPMTAKLQGELGALAALVASGGVAILLLRMQWMLHQRQLQRSQRLSELNYSRKVRRMERDFSQLLNHVNGEGRPDEAGAFARLLQQSTNQQEFISGERLAVRIEQILSSARNLVLLDGLTGLPNRNYFLERLNWESDYCKAQATPVALLFINIDKFKRINESYGHRVGDAILCHVASELKHLTGERDFLARFGSDEFSLIISTCDLSAKSDQDIRKYVHQRAVSLLDQFSTRATNHPKHLKISLSIGIALSDPSGTSPEELIRRSDLAMALAKNRRSGPISVFDINSEDDALNDYRIFNALESDINTIPERFSIVFQPIVDLTGQTLELEALVRWNNPDFPETPPDIFISLAERYRLIEDLGTMLVQRTLREFKHLQVGLDSERPMQLAINISPSQLIQDGFGPWLLKQLRLHAISPHCVTVEVTESAVIEISKELTDNLESLRQAGVRLALDDFGTGFSSLRLLMWLRPHELKIDKSFVQATAHDPVAEQIIHLLQNLAQTMGLTLIAEGVEDQATRDRLAAAGIRYFQGYLYAKPLRPQDLISSLRSNRHG
jgi:diguanylate cyclase (GGDEF)-like protein